MTHTAAAPIVSERTALLTGAAVAADVLVCLNRAVQRATIYPAEHPVVRQAVTPFIESMQAVLSDSPRFVLFVSRQALLVVRQAAAPESVPLPWLASRLSERGLASLTITKAIDETAAAELVTWLAKPSQDDSGPALLGVQIAWRNYALTRFTEQRSTSNDTDAAMLWQGVVHGLAADWLDCEGNEAFHGELDVEQMADDPVALAKFVRNTLLSQEGTGVAAVANRIVSFGGRLGELSEAGRAVVRQKLAHFIAELAPELRGQLLRIVPTDSPEKLATIGQIIDDLPRTLVLEVLQNIEVGPGHDQSSFISLLSKMVGLAAGDTEMHQALSHSLARAGVAEDVIGRQEDQLREALEKLFTTPVDRASMSQEYRDQLDALTERRQQPFHYDGSHLHSPSRADHLAVEIPRIAIAVLSTCPIGADAAILLDRARAAGPTMVAAEDVDSLALLATVACTVSGNAAATADEVHQARATLTFLEQPAVVTLLMKSIDDTASTLPLAAGDLFRACGLPAVALALDRLVSSTAPAVHSRVIGLLAQLDAAVLKVALTQARTQGRITPRVALGLLCHQEIGHVVEIADLFSYDEDPELRLQAYKALFSGSQANRVERATRRALDDSDHRVVELAVAETCARQDVTGIRALGHLLSRVVDATVERAQRRAVAVLVQIGTPTAREALATALSSRGRAIDRVSRRVSLLMARSLQELGDETSLAAVRAWRWSPAGVLSLVMRETVAA